MSCGATNLGGVAIACLIDGDSDGLDITCATVLCCMPPAAEHGTPNPRGDGVILVRMVSLLDTTEAEHGVLCVMLVAGIIIGREVEGLQGEAPAAWLSCTTDVLGCICESSLQ